MEFWQQYGIKHKNICRIVSDRWIFSVMTFFWFHLNQLYECLRVRPEVSSIALNFSFQLYECHQVRQEENSRVQSFSFLHNEFLRARPKVNLKVQSFAFQLDEFLQVRPKVNSKVRSCVFRLDEFLQVQPIVSSKAQSFSCQHDEYLRERLRVNLKVLNFFFLVLQIHQILHQYPVQLVLQKLLWQLLIIENISLWPTWKLRDGDEPFLSLSFLLLPC